MGQRSDGKWFVHLAPAHWARETVQLLSERTDARLMRPKIWPPNSFELNPCGLWNLGTITGICLQ